MYNTDRVLGPAVMIDQEIVDHEFVFYLISSTLGVAHLSSDCLAFRCFFFVKYRSYNNAAVLFHHICSAVDILQLKLFSFIVWLRKRAGDFRNHLKI